MYLVIQYIFVHMLCILKYQDTLIKKTHQKEINKMVFPQDIYPAY